MLSWDKCFNWNDNDLRLDYWCHYFSFSADIWKLLWLIPPQHVERNEFYNVILKGKNQLKFHFVSPWKKFITSAGSKMERSTTFPMKHSGWALLSAEGWPCYRWVGRWRRCLAVRRTEGNFTAATGVALNLINLNAGKECVKATGGNIQIYINIHIAAEIGSLRSVVGVSGSLTSGRNQCIRVFNSWNTFFRNFVALVLVFTFCWWFRWNYRIS